MLQLSHSQSDSSQMMSARHGDRPRDAHSSSNPNYGNHPLGGSSSSGGGLRPPSSDLHHASGNNGNRDNRGSGVSGNGGN